MAVLTGFLDLLFPLDISWGAVGGPEFDTSIVQFFNGKEQRNANRDFGLITFDVAHAIKTQEQLDVLIAFFREVRGSAYSFRFRDCTDFTLKDEQIAVADGIEDDFKITKTYGTGLNNEVRRIYLPATSPVYTQTQVFVNDIEQVSGWHIEFTQGELVFDTPPANGATIKLSTEFDIPARFGTDRMRHSIDDYDSFTWGQIPIVEIDASEIDAV